MDSISSEIWTFISDNLTALLVCVVCAAIVIYSFKRPSGIPPGPGWALPVLGHALSLGANPTTIFRDWRRKYGDIFSFYLGSRLVIVINGYDALVDAFQKNSDVFSDRPHILVTELISKGMGLVGNSGPVWKEQRRFTLSTLRDFGMGKRIMETAIRDEVDVFVEYIQGMGGSKFDFKQPVNTAVANIIFKILLGKRFRHDDPFFKDLMRRIDDNLQAIGATAVVNVIPFAAYLPGDLFKYKQILRNWTFFEDEFIKPAIERHVASYDDNDISDYAYAYVKEMKHNQEQGGDTSIDKGNLQKTLGDLYGAGSETTTTTLRWAVLLFMKYPEVQEKCFQEIKENVGLERPIEMSDKTNLPYLEATITEVQRFADIAPMSIWHSVPHDVTFRDFSFPKGVIIIPNLDSVLHDPDTFKNPDEFRPERFLDAAGKFQKVPEMIPFSLGKRACAGESLAKMELFLFLARLTQRFQFTYPEDEPPVDLQPVPGIVYSPKAFKVLALAR